MEPKGTKLPKGTGPGGSAGSALALCLIGVLASAIVARAVTLIAGAAPQVGSLISFAPAGQAGLPPVKVPAQRLAGHGGSPRACTLSLRTMKASGGSLIVEARNLRTGQALVHWAGTRTAGGAGDCGHTAHLALRGEDLAALARAADQPGPAAATLASAEPSRF
jgi:hypothetical protein